MKHEKNQNKNENVVKNQDERDNLNLRHERNEPRKKVFCHNASYQNTHTRACARAIAFLSLCENESFDTLAFHFHTFSPTCFHLASQIHLLT